MPSDGHLYEALRKSTPENPALWGWKVFSQHHEDGIIQHCLGKIAQKTTLNKYFFELCCGDGLENNTHLLLLQGFKGGWVDGNTALINRIEATLGGGAFDNLLVQEAFVVMENLPLIIKNFQNFFNVTTVDFLSVDLDGNDFYFLDVLRKELRPKLICAEYNASFPPPISMVIPYNPKHVWVGSNYYGASLQALVDLLEDTHVLISCEVSGANAFFVAKEFSNCFKIYDIKELYQKPRFNLTWHTGHRPSYRWLKDIIGPAKGRAISV